MEFKRGYHPAADRGVARLERMPEDPKQETGGGACGAGGERRPCRVLFVLLLARGGMSGVAELGVVGGDLLTKLLWVNVALAVFNLLPAFPMDGGRVLRALLAIRMDYVRATHIAANIGQGMAFLFGFLGLFSNPFLVFIALFVWMGASQEAGMVEMKSALGGVPVEQVMITKFRTLAPRDTLAAAVEQILAGAQQDFPIIENGEVVGILTRGDLLTGLGKGGQTAEVGDYMQRQIRTVAPPIWRNACSYSCRTANATPCPCEERRLGRHLYDGKRRRVHDDPHCTPWGATELCALRARGVRKAGRLGDSATRRRL